MIATRLRSPTLPACLAAGTLFGACLGNDGGGDPDVDSESHCYALPARSLRRPRVNPRVGET